MEKEIAIKIGKLVLKAELNDSRVAGKIYEKLPITAKVNTWGDEIYFPIPVRETIDHGVTEVEKGDLGYWPEGACFCIFFGPTPMSTADKIIPASEVEIVGKLQSADYTGLKKARTGEPITLEKEPGGTE